MSPRRLLVPVALLFAVLLAAAGCTKAQPGTVTLQLTSSTPGTPVAHYNDQTLSAESVEAALASMSPPLRARYLQPDARKTYVEDVARFDLLVQKAAKEGLANDPEVVAATRRMMVHRLLSKALDATPPSDADVAAYFQAHQPEFARPEMVRLGEILLSVKPGDAASLKKARATAQDLLKKVKALPASDVAGFGELARHYSQDPRAKLFGGDLRYLTHDLLAREFGPEVATAGFALQATGDATTVETPKGVYLLRLLNRSQAFSPTLAQVRPQIVARLTSEARNQHRADFIAQAEKDAHLTVDEKAVAAMKVDASAPAKPLGHPAPDVFALPHTAPPRPVLPRPGNAR
jgi:peptidyl-prolyl cis-trans isomerase C